MLTLPSISRVKNLKGKYVLLRSELNVPLVGGKAGDVFRIMQALPTVRFLKRAGAKVIVIAHIGRDPKESLKPVAQYMNGKTAIGFVPELFGSRVDAMIDTMKNGSAILLENVRSYKEEENNDTAFAKRLAAYADIYVDDAFGAAHRSHASIVGIPKYIPAYAGLLFAEETAQLSKVLAPHHPFIFVLGGAKFETKMPLLKKYVDIADAVYVGGALANTLLVAQGYSVGRSVAEDVRGAKALARHPRVHVPCDVVVETGKGETAIRTVEEILPTDMIVDIGPKTAAAWTKDMVSAKEILMNGPMGFYERGYVAGTKKLLHGMVHSSARTTIGGGDTVALARTLKMEKRFTFVSTAGGAMLDFLASGTLPGIEVIKKIKK
ncbi:MAG: phosphoglycerate kinase [Candidatus Yonathbacteria bacterium]|nr:phosphoglycerate kinase [Candidatus Yonathbacteria bacterium]